MRIAVAFKAVPDAQDVQVAGDRTLDFSKAKLTISEYDKNALELGAQLADEAVAITVGGKDIDNSKLKKDVMARGMGHLYMAADDALADLDAAATAAALADVLAKAGDVDAVICGDGSADNYLQQVDVQLAEKLGWPVVTAACKVEVNGSTAVVTRALEDCTEVVEVELPAVISVTPDVAEPRIPGMKDILAAGKKPMNVAGTEGSYANEIEVVSCKAPEQADRKQVVLEAGADGAVEQFVAALKAAL